MIALLHKIINWLFADYDKPIAKKQYLYRYKHRVFWCDPHTVKKLNEALAMSNSEERYKRVLDSDRNKK